MAARFEVTEDDIQAVVGAFYKLARLDPAIGPIFMRHVVDWPSHEEKICGFWRNAILGDGSYQGNPMRVHMGVSNLHPDHFAIWLSLFDRVLFDLLSEPAAQAWSALAHRIGRGLRMGLTFAPDGSSAAPKLFS